MDDARLEPHVIPDLSHYVGQAVVAIEDVNPDAEEGDVAWTMKLGNGVVIRSRDTSYSSEPPRHLIGEAIKMVTLQIRNTTIIFTNGDILNLNPMLYTIHDPTKKFGGEVYPQRSEDDPLNESLFKGKEPDVVPDPEA